MLIDKFEALVAEVEQHENYFYRNMPREERQVLAQASFDRISPEQKELCEEKWAKFRTRYVEEHGVVVPWTPADFIYFRFLCQTNLFFLCKLLEKYSLVSNGKHVFNGETHNTHEEICNGFFVNKRPGEYSHFEKFANDYADLKDRMLLVPRGGFKSSIDMADCVQYIICWPEVTILILTGVNQLAIDFVGEVRQHFTLDETSHNDAAGKPLFGPRKLQDKDTSKWSESLFQVFFPEHCVKPGGLASAFQTPAGGDDKEPTLRSASIEQNLSGWHYGVMKLDDVVTNENSLTPARMLGIINQININEAMLHPFGFMDVIGTWYDEKDYYGVTIKREEEAAKNGEAPAMKIHLRACWWPTEQAKAAGKIEEEMTEKDYVLWFPERLTYEFLKAKKKKSPDTFPIKYLNDPRVLHKVKFPRELLVRRTIPHTQLPKEGLIVTTVDTAYSTKSWADYTVIMTAVIYGGRFYIIDMVRGRFNEFELPAVIANTAFRWKPKRIAIEESVGVKWMGKELKRELDKLQISVPVTYCSLGLGSKKRSKAMKAKPVLRLLGDERLFFSIGCNNLDEIYKEMESFTGTDDDSHDDIISAISLLVNEFGAYADMDSKVNFVSQQFVSDEQEAERHKQIYGLGAYAKYNSNFALDDNPVTNFQVGQTTEYVSDVDPLADLFG